MCGSKAECLVSWSGLIITSRSLCSIRFSWCQTQRSRNHVLSSMQRTLKVESRCGHEQTISTSVAGMERPVCESCGHISIKMLKANTSGLNSTGGPVPVRE